MVIRSLAIVGLLSTAPAHAEAMRTPVDFFLCDTAAHAVAFADEVANGAVDDIAADRVGRVAQGQVCGQYRGVAKIESEEIRLAGGFTYRVTAYRFERDDRLAWLAERTFAPAEPRRDVGL